MSRYLWLFLMLLCLSLVASQTLPELLQAVEELRFEVQQLKERDSPKLWGIIQ